MCVDRARIAYRCFDRTEEQLSWKNRWVRSVLAVELPRRFSVHPVYLSCSTKNTSEQWILSSSVHLFSRVEVILTRCSRRIELVTSTFALWIRYETPSDTSEQTKNNNERMRTRSCKATFCFRWDTGTTTKRGSKCDF